MTNGQSELPPPKEILPSHFLYTQVLRECEGIVRPVYWPEETGQLWRCTCGHENNSEATVCGGCGVSRDWLREHFDRSRLAAGKLAHEAEEETERRAAESRARRAKNRGRNRRRILLLLGAAALLTAFCLLLFLKLVPDARYRGAVRLRENGDYLAAAERFSALGRDAEAAECHLLHARALAGKDDVYAVTTAEIPVFRITPEGVFSVDREKLADSGLPFSPFRVPDVVDDILVTALGDLCFMNCDCLEAVILPDSVRSIGERCFFGCTALTGVTLPAGLTNLAERAFIRCTALLTLTLPAGITKVPIRLCNSCVSLQSVVFLGEITSIGDYAFSGCVSLQSLPLSRALTRIGTGAFFDCDALRAVYAGSAADFAAVTVGEENGALTAHLSFDS